MTIIRFAFAISLLGGTASWGDGALAAEGRFYAGLTGSAEAQDGRYHKETYRKGATQGHSEHDDADESVYGWGAVLGYRWPLSADGRVHLSGELEGMYHSGELHGQLAGICAGHPPPCTRSSDSWPDEWWLEKDFSWGATLKFGVKASVLHADDSLYVLAGFRRVHTDFRIQFSGCPTTAGCPPGTYITNESIAYERDFDAWTAGAGWETRLAEDVGLQLEVRYTDYERESWVSVPPEVVVPAALTGRDIGLSLRVLRYF